MSMFKMQAQNKIIKSINLKYFTDIVHIRNTGVGV